MAWLTIHMWLLLLIAFLLGLLFGWWIWGRGRQTGHPMVTATDRPIDYRTIQETAPRADEAKPISALSAAGPETASAAEAAPETPELTNPVSAFSPAETETPGPEAAMTELAPSSATEQSTDADEPVLLSSANQGPADDLKKIKGVGPQLEGLLNSLGIFYFHQIADWTDDNVAWVDRRLKFPGRITRENWVDQASVLREGGETEFAKRYNKGETPSSYTGIEKEGPDDGGTDNS